MTINKNDTNGDWEIFEETDCYLRVMNVIFNKYAVMNAVCDAGCFIIQDIRGEFHYLRFYKSILLGQVKW